MFLTAVMICAIYLSMGGETGFFVVFLVYLFGSSSFQYHWCVLDEVS